MPFYLRTSISLGPFHFDLSKSGLGASSGVKDFRVGMVIAVLCLFTSSIFSAQPKPDLRTSYVESGPPQDLSYAGVKRIRAFIYIPQGRTEEEIRATLTRAATTIGQREKARATNVWAYRPQDKVKSGPFTVGSAIYAPNGRWEDAASKAPMSVTLELAKIYFQDAPLKFEKGQQVLLKSQSDQPIEISQKPTSWGKSDIIARLPPQTSAIVLETYERPLTPDQMFIRYQIRVHLGGKTIEGWVHADELTKRVN